MLLCLCTGSPDEWTSLTFRPRQACTYIGDTQRKKKIPFFFFKDFIEEEEKENTAKLFWCEKHPIKQDQQATIIAQHPNPA